MTQSFVPPADLVAYVEARGYAITPITNATAAAQDGVDLKIMAYELRGPRGNKTILCKNRDGLLSLGAAQLWCDGVDYATASLRARRHR